MQIKLKFATVSYGTCCQNEDLHNTEWLFYKGHLSFICLFNLIFFYDRRDYEHSLNFLMPTKWVLRLFLLAVS